MFCPMCGKKIPENAVFCPDCGGKLRNLEKTEVNPDTLNLDEAAKTAQSGFDAGTKPYMAKNEGAVPQVGPGKAVKPVKLSLPMILGIITALIIAYAVVTGPGLGKVRNCIGSKLSSAPECSDCDPVYESTTLNGVPQGNCIAHPGTGRYDDQCDITCK